MRPANVPIEYDAAGKPKLPSSLPPIGGSPDAIVTSLDARFNLTHSAELALIAVALGCDVGIDVERLRTVPHLEQIARRYFHPTEASEIMAAPVAGRSTNFLRCWTGKEAVLKAVGLGVSAAFDRLQVPVSEHGGEWIECSMTGKRRNANSQDTLTVAAEMDIAACRCWLEPLAPSDEYIGALASVGQRRRVVCRSLRL
jgi:4'-phosphopantetheinyl transferase